MFLDWLFLYQYGGLNDAPTICQPYNINADGFYFEDMSAYNLMVEKCFDSFGLPVEEFEIQFTEGENIDFELFEVWGIHQGNVCKYLDAVDRLTHHKKTNSIIMADMGFCLDKNLATFDVELHYCDQMRDLAMYLVENGKYGDIPEIIQQYIDYDALAIDLEAAYTEVNIAGKILYIAALNFINT